MSDEWFILAKAALGFGLPLAFGFWQLRDVRRELARDRNGVGDR